MTTKKTKKTSKASELESTEPTCNTCIFFLKRKKPFRDFCNRQREQIYILIRKHFLKTDGSVCSKYMKKTTTKKQKKS